MKQVISLVLFGLFCGSAVLTDASDQNKPDGASQSGRIVNGKAVSIVKYKYALSLRVNGVFECGATIITHKHALTAAHCVYPQRFEPMRVSCAACCATYMYAINDILHDFRSLCMAVAHQQSLVASCFRWSVSQFILGTIIVISLMRLSTMWLS